MKVFKTATMLASLLALGVQAQYSSKDALKPGIRPAKDYSKMDPEVLKIQDFYSQTGSLKTTIPAKMAAGQNGYLIATNRKFVQESTKLKAFIAHKERLGFKVHVATEEDFGISKKGNGKGRHQAELVRKWMKDNYQKLNLLYTLVIENPHPDEGMIPLVKFRPRKYVVYTPEQKKFYPKYLKYKDNPRTEDGKFLLWDGDDPSEYYYADLDSDFDANRNTILSDKEDSESGKINGTAEVYVGRIPLYGGDHPFSQISDVDVILQRTMDYENDTRNISWRKNLFYVGGADNRFKGMQDHFLTYNGGLMETYRHSSGYGYEPSYTKWNNDIISSGLNQNGKFGFINFQEHGSWNSMAGQINNKSAIKLKRDYPAYVYLGGCDVHSPEHGENVTHSLFRSIGIAAMGATRSVTGLGGDKDTQSIANYERLYFGQSVGEAHWSTLSGLADGMQKVGASNFLMNLIGDPSVVIMPETEVSPLILAPNMDTLKFRHQHKSENFAGYQFTVRNTTDKEVSYDLTLTEGLTTAERQFTLPANGTKRMKVYFPAPAKLSVGLHQETFTISANGLSASRNIHLNVYGRNLLYSQNFDTMAERKIVMWGAKGDKLDKLRKMTEKKAADTFVTLPAKSRADLAKAKIIPGEADATISAKIKFDKAPKMHTVNKKVPATETEEAKVIKVQESQLLQFLNFGKTYQCFDFSIDKDKLFVIFRTVKGNAEKEAESKIELPVPATGKWHSFIASVNRAKQKMTLIFNGKKYETSYTPVAGQGLVFDKLRFGYGKNNSNIYIDELNIFDYELSSREVNALVNNKTIKLTFPKNNDLANPAGVNLSWKSKSKDSEYVVAIANNANFKGAKFITTTSTSANISDLKDKTTYFWKVGFKANGKAQFVWDSFSTFTTDSTLEDPEITIRKKELKSAQVKDNGYTDKLTKIASALGKANSNGKRKKVELFFAKVSGPSWLRVHSDGSLTTNFGAPKAGKHEFEFSVSTRYGLPVKFKRTIIAK